MTDDITWIAHVGQEPVTERLTNQLRFVWRDRDFDPINKKLVLQQMWQDINSGAERWVDVPMGVE